MSDKLTSQADVYTSLCAELLRVKSQQRVRIVCITGNAFAVCPDCQYPNECPSPCIKEVGVYFKERERREFERVKACLDHSKGLGDGPI